MGWATEESKQLEMEERRSREQREWAVHCEKVISRDSPQLFKQLVAYLVQQTNQFAADHPGFGIAADPKNANLLRIHKTTYPTLTLDVRLTDRTVEMHWMVVENQRSAPVQDEKQIAFTVDSAGELYLDHKPCNECGDRILGTILSPLRRN